MHSPGAAPPAPRRPPAAPPRCRTAPSPADSSAAAGNPARPRQPPAPFIVHRRRRTRPFSDDRVFTSTNTRQSRRETPGQSLPRRPEIGRKELQTSPLEFLPGRAFAQLAMAQVLRLFRAVPPRLMRSLNFIPKSATGPTQGRKGVELQGSGMPDSYSLRPCSFASLR